jgi:hypothetical protein
MYSTMRFEMLNAMMGDENDGGSSEAPKSEVTGD